MDASIARILALDLGKFKSVLCAMEVGSREHAFEAMTTTPATIDEFLARCRTIDPTYTIVVLETCDVAGWVHDCCLAAGVRVSIVNLPE